MRGSQASSLHHTCVSHTNAEQTAEGALHACTQVCVHGIQQPRALIHHLLGCRQCRVQGHECLPLALQDPKPQSLQEQNPLTCLNHANPGAEPCVTVCAGQQQYRCSQMQDDPSGPLILAVHMLAYARRHKSSPGRSGTHAGSSSSSKQTTQRPDSPTKAGEAAATFLHSAPSRTGRWPCCAVLARLCCLQTRELQRGRLPHTCTQHSTQAVSQPGLCWVHRCLNATGLSCRKTFLGPPTQTQRRWHAQVQQCKASLVTIQDMPLAGRNTTRHPLRALGLNTHKG